MTSALVIFLATYLVVAGQKIPGLRLDRTSAALLGAVAMVATGVLTQAQAVRAVHFDTLLLLLGMMVLTEYLTEAGFFRLCSFWAVRLSRSPRGLLAWVVALAGGLSALFVNDTICLMMTPLLLQTCEDTGVDPVPYLLALATAANIGSAAMLTGNPQNMIVGTHSGWSYAGFALRMIPVAAGGLLIDWGFLRWRFRDRLPREPFKTTAEPPRVRRRLLAKGLAVTAFVLAGFLAGRGLSGMAMAGAAVMIVLARLPPGPVFERLNWSLLVFFSGLFVVVAGLNQAGWGEVFFRAAAAHLGATPLIQLVTFSGAAAILSNVVSNVPLVLMAVPWVPRLENPPLLWLALAMASTFAGNLTLVGSVANVIVVEVARGRAALGFRDFLRVGVPVTLLTLAWGVAALALYRLWG